MSEKDVQTTIHGTVKETAPMNSNSSIVSSGKDNKDSENTKQDTALAQNTTNYNDNNNDENNKHKKQKRKNNDRWAWRKKWKQKKRDQKNGVVPVDNDNSNNNIDDNDSSEKKKNMRKISQNITWVDDSKQVNTGSFAHPDMQALFNMQLDIPIPKKDGIANNNTNANADQDDKSGVEEKDEKDTTNSVQIIEDTKLPKRKVALLIAFIGSKYHGMQMNKDYLTIQALIELAMYKAKLISPSNFGYPNKYSWSSSARTDKGVHSCAQVSSAKIMVPTDDLDEVRELINKELPDDIIILDVLRAARSFVAKTGRDKVRYQYMLPSFLVQDHKTTKQILKDVTGSANGNSLKEWSSLSPEEINELREALKTYRAPKETLEKLKETLSRFCGTRKYHNYTSKKDSSDDSARRYIHSFDILDTVVDDHGVEWISTGVVGQSFLLHQIRKMISMTIDVTRGATDIAGNKSEYDDVMDESFSPKYMSINVAPAQGLFLEMSFFDNYNKKLLGKGDKLEWYNNPDSPATLRWKDFKENKIMKHIMKEEDEQNNFLKYLFVQEIHINQLKYEATAEKKHTLYKTKSER